TATRERVAERSRGQQRRREGRPAARTIDDEGREGCRRATYELLLQARRAALAVVERLVAEDPPADRPDPPSRDRSRQAIEIRRLQRRIAEALEDQIADPGVALSRAGPVDLGVEAISGPEARQRGPRDR